MLKQVLIVEDSEPLALALERTLAAHGHSVSIVRTAGAARTTLLDADSRKSIDVVLVDHGLPDGHGLDLLKELAHGPRASSPSFIIMGPLHAEFLTPEKFRRYGAKAAIAKEAGADETIVYTRDDFAVEVKRLTGGKGVDVIYDSVGLTTFLKGLDLLRPRGMMALFGNSSGKPEPFDPAILNPKGSLFLTRPTLGHYILTREELLWRAGDVLSWIGAGKLKLLIDKTYPLSDTADAHRDLEGRKTTGKLLVIP